MGETDRDKLCSTASSLNTLRNAVITASFSASSGGGHGYHPYRRNQAQSESIGKHVPFRVGRRLLLAECCAASSVGPAPLQGCLVYTVASHASRHSRDDVQCVRQTPGADLEIRSRVPVQTFAFDAEARIPPARGIICSCYFRCRAFEALDCSMLSLPPHRSLLRWSPRRCH